MKHMSNLEMVQQDHYRQLMCIFLIKAVFSSWYNFLVLVILPKLQVLVCLLMLSLGTALNLFKYLTMAKIFDIIHMFLYSWGRFFFN